MIYSGWFWRDENGVPLNMEDAKIMTQQKRQIDRLKTKFGIRPSVESIMRIKRYYTPVN